MYHSVVLLWCCLIWSDNHCLKNTLTLYVKALSVLYLCHIDMVNIKLKVAQVFKNFKTVYFFLSFSYQGFNKNCINVSSLILGTQMQAIFSV